MHQLCSTPNDHNSRRPPRHAMGLCAAAVVECAHHCAYVAQHWSTARAQTQCNRFENMTCLNEHMHRLPTASSRVRCFGRQLATCLGFVAEALDENSRAETRDAQGSQPCPHITLAARTCLWHRKSTRSRLAHDVRNRLRFRSRTWYTSAHRRPGQTGDCEYVPVSGLLEALDLLALHARMREWRLPFPHALVQELVWLPCEFAGEPTHEHRRITKARVGATGVTSGADSSSAALGRVIELLLLVTEPVDLVKQVVHRVETTRIV